MGSFVALLRGINVGGKNRVDMKKLKTVFESLNCTNVSTYLNSGNVLFESTNTLKELSPKVQLTLKKEFGFTIPTLVKSQEEVKKIESAIPKMWKNDSDYKTDVAYLFPDIDNKKTLDLLPLKKEFMDIAYVTGAIYWRIARKNINKSQLNKIISYKLYQQMTIRNINTARFLAGIKK